MQTHLDQRCLMLSGWGSAARACSKWRSARPRMSTQVLRFVFRYAACGKLPEANLGPNW